jgi:hypothetical protein
MPSAGHYRLAPGVKFVIIDHSVRIEPARKTRCADPIALRAIRRRKQPGVTLASPTHGAREICTTYHKLNVGAFKMGEAL